VNETEAFPRPTRPIPDRVTALEDRLQRLRWWVAIETLACIALCTALIAR
jgi:hypothetical protein